jgi:ABC-type sugar transport system ATPase subunit
LPREAVALRGISKRYPGLLALDDVSFSVAPGSCHAICGENGAGKSTLGKILAGILTPDGGEILLDGARVRFSSPRDALGAGVAMVHQELASCDNLTVAENLCLGALPKRRFLLDRRSLRSRALERLAAIDATVDPARQMSDLSVAERQLVQIASAVASGARVIIFDEPTSSLGYAETESLYTLIGRLQEHDVAVIYVSHRMAEIFSIADTITVLRDGRHVGTWPAAELDEPELVRQMIGRGLDTDSQIRLETNQGEERLRVENLSSPGKFEGVSLDVRAGEVVGLAGLVGAGRSEIANALFGLDANARGRVWVRGEPVALNDTRGAMRCRIGYVPEDRKRHGLVLSMCAGHNATLPILERFSRAGFISASAEHNAASGFFERLRIKAAPADEANHLSGGTQQKLVLAKWLAADCDILILDEPTRGVDIGTKAELHAWIHRLTHDGAAILLISSELPELLNVATRIIVLRGGRMVGELPRARATQESLLRMMAGLERAERC